MPVGKIEHTNNSDSMPTHNRCQCHHLTAKMARYKIFTPQTGNLTITQITRRKCHNMDLEVPSQHTIAMDRRSLERWTRAKPSGTERCTRCPIEVSCSDAKHKHIFCLTKMSHLANSYIDPCQPKRCYWDELVRLTTQTEPRSLEGIASDLKRSRRGD